VSSYGLKSASSPRQAWQASAMRPDVFGGQLAVGARTICPKPTGVDEQHLIEPGSSRADPGPIRRALPAMTPLCSCTTQGRVQVVPGKASIALIAPCSRPETRDTPGSTRYKQPANVSCPPTRHDSTTKSTSSDKRRVSATAMSPCTRASIGAP
jgi:hypothetical protein